jgi:carboxymethylenebutenolidase
MNIRRFFPSTRLAGGTLCALALSLPCSAKPSIKTESMIIGSQHVYIARPADTKKHPALLLIHEWWGLDGWMKGNAERFARKGYVVMDADLYHGRSTKDPKVARSLDSALNEGAAVGELKSDLTALRARKDVDPSHVGVMGWCMGGGYALKVALAETKVHLQSSGRPVQACVICYGELESDSGKLAGAPPILGIFGEKDQKITAGAAKSFGEALQKDNVPNQIKEYSGADHAFMNPGQKARYDPTAANDAWHRIDTFLAQYLP